MPGSMREARPRHDPAVLAGLQAVDVGPVAVDFLADVVPGAVGELVAVAGLLDHRPRRRRPPASPAAARFAAKASFTRLIAASRAAATMSKTFAYFSGTSSPTNADAGQVAVDGPRLVELRPQVDEHEVARAGSGVSVAGVGLVVRVAAVRADADDRRAVGRHPVVGEVVHDPLLHRRASVVWPLRLDLVGDERPRHVVGRVGSASPPRGATCLLLVVPGRLEQLDQVAGRRRRRTPNDCTSSTVPASTRPMYGLAFRGEYSIATRFAPVTSVADAGLEFLPAAVDGLRLPGRWSSDAGSMAWTSFSRLAGRGDEVEPAPRELLLVEPDDPLGEDVDARGSRRAASRRSPGPGWRPAPQAGRTW